VERAKLLKLADFLEKKVKSKWFNLLYWYAPGFEKKVCNTTACALGWATQIWPRQLKLTAGSVMFRNENKEFMDSFQVGANFFGISKTQSWYLFGELQYPPHKTSRLCVVRRIRSFVKNDGYIPTNFWGDLDMNACRSALTHKSPKEIVST
jgi:hypothetical protein